jgi:hypothetical protein
MKTSVIAPAGLFLAAALALSAMGCRVTNIGVPSPGAPVDPGGAARCKATCDRLVEDEAIPRSAAKACHSACQSPAARSPAQPGDVRVADSGCCGPCRRRPLPPPACQSDSDCPEDAACESGACK